jgi:hypothetical protein
MARTGLRMMPTFPSPSLKFRTAGFPQYGFKASLSDRACPSLRWLSLLPACPPLPKVCRDPSPASAQLLRPGTVSSPGPGLGRPLCGRLAPPYPRGPWLRSEFCCLGPSSLLRPHPPVSPARGDFAAPAAYTPRLRCAGAPRRPARPSLLSPPCFLRVPPTLRRWVRAALPLCRPHDTRLPRSTSESPPTRSVSASYTRRSYPFDAASFAFRCGPRICPALHAGFRGTVSPPLFAASVAGAPSGVRLEGRTGNLPSS